MRTSSLLASIIIIALAGRALADEPARVSASIDGAKQPSAAVSRSGKVFVAFGAGSAVHCATSEDGGKTFAAPVKIADVEGLMLGMRRGPRVAAGEKTVCVTAIGKAGDLLAWTSPDGKTWAGPNKVNDHDGAAKEGLHALSASTGDELACAWLDLRADGTALEIATSKDGGATWAKNVTAYRSPEGHICECCHPSVAFDAKGGVLLLFRNWLEGARDMYVVRSKDGKTFGKAAKLGAGSWPLKTCPMAGGAVAALPDGNACAAWVRDQQVFLTTPKEPERALGDGRQPWLAVGPSGPYVAWVTRGGEVTSLAPNARSNARLSLKGEWPVVAASPDAKGPVVAAWEENGAVVARPLKP